MTENVRVRVTASQTVRYDQIREISPERYEQWLKLAENENADESEFAAFGDLVIDYSDICEGEELKDVEVFECSKDGKCAHD